MLNLELGRSYDFQTISSGVLENYYQNLKLVSVVNFDLVRSINAINNDVVVVTRKLKEETGLPLLDPKLNTYYVFSTKDGDLIIFGSDWIISDTIQETGSIKVVVTFNDLSFTDVERLRRSLQTLGYKNFDITIENTTS